MSVDYQSKSMRAGREKVKALDGKRRRREAIGFATGMRSMLVPIPTREKWKRQKAERLADADEWIKKVRARTTTERP